MKNPSQHSISLKQWREENCYSQSAFARLLKEKCGLDVDRTAVWYWENGTMPRKEALQAIRKITGGKVKPDSFVRPA